MDKESEKVSVWTIAGGVLLAFVIWRAFNVWQYNRAVAEANAVMAKTMQEITRSSAASRQQFAQNQLHREEAALERERQAREAKELKSDERCINKQRFRRVPNGWDQIGSC
jgi:hypothetical protein